MLMFGLISNGGAARFAVARNFASKSCLKSFGGAGGSVTGTGDVTPAAMQSGAFESLLSTDLKEESATTVPKPG